jgi:hypothetical protein
MVQRLCCLSWRRALSRHPKVSAVAPARSGLTLGGREEMRRLRESRLLGQAPARLAGNVAQSGQPPSQMRQN